MANETFSATLDAWARKSKARMLGIAQQSGLETFNDADTPVAKGGRMHVDTGFLRASGQASLNGMPSGPVRGDPNGSYEPDPTIIELEVAKMKIGDTLFFGWTANYAGIRENHDAFVRLAVQKWPQTVARVTAELKARIK